ncbi:amino acid ABC transporter permease [Mycetocola zhadangensis]|uniref:Amino acid ABC transporter permease n=1 Tax=Mycetocola zhadangensis TaxID=1164595 RepID=A0A3L7J4I0_9MICO|nr:amino acid ABC transporter permease [Mycetocola zhadangensis]RLQ85586.1 amino acid ABC transporter permease [Mycetocola zhadangensis]GGE83914.1 ABC transporter permease [Mycetocola zhadangensis]
MDPTTEPIKAVKLRHPVRTAFAVVILLLVVLFVWDAATRDAYQWPLVGQYLFDRRISQAAVVTLALTILSMILAIVMGLVLAVMRLSDNPVLKVVSWVYLWIFRGTPVYVQLVFWGLLGTIYRSVTVGIPFTSVEFFTISPFSAIDLFWLAVLGLAFNEAAYMAEIVRGGILSVPRGQDEAARALGMSWRQTMLRVVVPQSMRVIIPPTGNEVISMLKTTSLVTALGFSLELYARTRAISAQIYATVPLLIVASIWYLLVTSILMVGQHYLEKYYGRGVAPQREPEDDPELPETETATETTGIAGGNAEAVPPPKREHQ